MPKIQLHDDTAYDIKDYAAPDSFVILLGGVTAEDVLKTMTEGNLSEIRFVTDKGAVTGVYHNKLLCGYVDHGDTLAISINDADLCRYGLTLDEDNRIISYEPQRYAPEGSVIVDTLPAGNVYDYLYVDGEYIHDPLPEAEHQPTQEERIAALEAQLASYEAAYTEGVNEA